MERKLLKDLVTWKNSEGRKPLILQGARQVGKTWLLKHFGETYFEDVCYINCEKSKLLRELLQGDIDVVKIIAQLSVFHGKLIDPQHTLLIFDEIQEVPKALTALKYFAEEAPQYHICCSGSFLGIALHPGVSFPVGKVDFLTLHPLSFEEFLLANGENMLVDYMSESTDLQIFADKLENYLKSYLIIGGMPEVVQRWIDTKDFSQAEKVMGGIVESYFNEISKHAPANIVAKIRYVWDAIPSQLAKENKKFVYGVVREGARARDFEEAILWLSDTGLVRKVYNVSTPKLPLKAYADLKTFKLYLLDVGMLRFISGMSPQIILEGNRIYEEFKGTLTEQYVIQELSVNQHINANYYWTSKNSAEVDFLIDTGTDIIPVECKSSINLQAKSLKVYAEKYLPGRIFTFSLQPYRQNKIHTNYSLYQLFTIFKKR